jgi:NAD-dependent dihydropyrimidine dehydrogenase PreA subunit
MPESSSLWRNDNGEGFMTFIITEPCIGTKDTACVDVCPVDCIHPTKDADGFEDAKMLFIDPAECIDCGACEPACPVEAIFEEDAVPDKWKSYIKMNYDHFEEK